MKVVLFQPQIPQNTGNIARTCSVTGTPLYLVEPLGFQVNDRWLKRAGLDYWDQLQSHLIDSLDAFISAYPHFYFFSSKAKKRYTDVQYEPEAALIFGSENGGLPEHLFNLYPDRFVTLPMLEGARCLNLATSVGIALYEALRQQNFPFSIQQTHHL